jgi:transposase
MRPFGEEITELLDYVPASFRIIEHVRFKYSCDDLSCDSGVVCADLPPLPITKGRPGPGLLAYVATAKYTDHLPLNRLERIIAREGIDIRRSTLCDWVDQTAWLLRPITQEMARSLLRHHVVGVDETSVRVRDKDAGGGIRKGSIWAYRGAPGEVVFVHTATKCGDGPATFLAKYRGFLQADAANVFDQLFKSGQIVEVGCCAHARRKWHKAKDAFPHEASWALAAIRRLYKIEAEAKERGLSPEERHALRQEKAAPIVDGYFAWLKELKPSVVAGTLLAKAVNYSLNQEQALRRYLDDGRLAIDNNNVERALRQVAVGRRAWLFAGSEKGAEIGATLYSLVVSCGELGVDPFEYLRDVIERVSTHPANAVAELTPRGWFAARQAAGDTS